jgi:hypothetical protein
LILVKLGFSVDNTIEKEMKSSLESFIASVEDNDTYSFDDLSNKDKKAAYLSTHWDAFVMSQFDESELADGYPRVNGLRRVAELLLGDIIQSCPTEVYPVAQRDETQRSTVVHSITFLWFDKTERTYAEVADCYSGNQDPDFLVYSPSTASTRAEARALRKALKLKKCSFEEISHVENNHRTLEKKNKAGSGASRPDPISSSQIRFLDKRCKDLDVDVMKLINQGQGRFDAIENMTKVEAKELIDFLAKVSAGKEEIESFIKGYNPNWRD